MSDPLRPADIARETLKRLAAANLAPTPANFQACYNEIANLPNAVPFPEVQLRQIAAGLCVRGEGQGKQYQKLIAAINRRSWQGVQESLAAIVAMAADGPSRVTPLPNLQAPLALRLASFVEAVQPALGDENEHLKGALGEMLQLLRSAEVDVSALQEQMQRVSREASCVAEEQAEIKVSLLKLLQLMIANIGELSLDDGWMHGQVDALLAVIGPPLTLRHLDEMERCLRDVLMKQGRAKARSMAAREEVRQMLTAFIARLGDMSESSTSFQERLESTAHRIEGVSRIEDLAPLLDEVLSATREMAEHTRDSRTQLESLQSRVQAAEAELTQLHLELDSASAQARHDPLTDALNRKGLDEALAREIASMHRTGQPLALSLLDVDNFKRLNDNLGHEAGDLALIHLAKVARASIRPSDTLARYGGEEFVVLMPDTTAQQAVEVMTRLQRELTKAIFLSDKEKVLITFSAGVAVVTDGEEAMAAVKRADRAMYLAKRAGKNRVLLG